jgi:hypothetical protein
MTDILDTYKPLFAAVTSIALTAAAVDSGGFPSSAQWFVAFGVGASTAALWHFGVTLFLSSFPLLPNANWETPPSPPEPLESAQEPQGEPQRVDNQPVRQEARTGQPVTLAGQPKRESIPAGIGRVFDAIADGTLTSPVSLNKLNEMGFSRFNPKVENGTEAHIARNFLISRGVINSSGDIIGRVPRLTELPPYPAESELHN